MSEVKSTRNSLFGIALMIIVAFSPLATAQVAISRMDTKLS